MYEVDEQDRVIGLKDIPRSSVGAPVPIVLANERRVILAYLIQEKRPIWEMSKEQLAATQDFREEIAMIRFDLCTSHMWGLPNDEVLHGHPLAARGLSCYGGFKVENSSWIRALERMNSVHRLHDPARFWRKQHLILTFHDSTFECVCERFDVKIIRGNRPGDAVTEMIDLLDETRAKEPAMLGRDVKS
jgi:hypothetical protein